MISRLSVRSFQKSVRRTVDLDPQVTVFVGETDSGKSSMLRALRWLCLNDAPKGDFISWGSDIVVVNATVDGHLISRIRDSKGNHYSLDGTEYKAFGVNVPEPIADVLRMTNENFQGQIDPPFWLSQAAGQVARDLNRIVDLGMIDDSLAAVASKIRSARIKHEVADRRLQDARETVRSLDWVPEFRKRLDKLLGIEDDIAQNRLRLRRIDSLVEGLSSVVLRQKIAATIVPAIGKLLAVADRIAELTTRKQELDALIERIERGEAELCQARKENESASRDVKRALRGRCPLCGTAIESSPLHAQTCTSGTSRR